MDGVAWAAAWLHWATGEQQYLDGAAQGVALKLCYVRHWRLLAVVGLVLAEQLVVPNKLALVPKEQIPTAK
jgi:hypothetical protein